ncbi:hypothetical protein GCM10010302_26000 [Streptomyces polychromogenes]|uniref:Uncharacterized protein n=2 Tax=Streptomyces TaxID=1883 RepID=A0ABN0VCB8_9ACTN
MPRARSRAGLPHLLGLTLLLLVLACAHGADGAHAATDHATAQHAAAPATTPEPQPARTTTVAATPHTATMGPDVLRPTTTQADTAGGTALQVGAVWGDAPLSGDGRARADRAGVAAAGDAVGRHDPGHPVHECVPAPPRAASGSDSPAAPATPVEGCAPAGGPSRTGTARAAAPSGAAAPAPPGSPAVLRV